MKQFADHFNRFPTIFEFWAHFLKLVSKLAHGIRNIPIFEHFDSCLIVTKKTINCDILNTMSKTNSKVKTWCCLRILLIYLKFYLISLKIKETSKDSDSDNYFHEVYNDLIYKRLLPIPNFINIQKTFAHLLVAECISFYWHTVGLIRTFHIKSTNT